MTLTPRQKQIAAAYLSGGSFEAIASRLGMTQAALSHELQQMRMRLGVANHHAMLRRLRELAPAQDALEVCRQSPAQWWSVIR